MVIFTRQNARFLTSPAFGPMAAWKLSNIKVKRELSNEKAALTVPALQPLPLVSTSGASTATELIVQVPGGGVAAAAAAQSTESRTKG